MTITKADIVENIYRQAGFTKKQSAEIVDNLFKIIKETLARGEKVKISGFGNFTIRDKAARTGRNPQTGESMKISARRVLSFKPSQILKEDIISRYAHRLDKSGQEDESIPPKSMVSKALNSFLSNGEEKGSVHDD